MIRPVYPDGMGSATPHIALDVACQILGSSGFVFLVLYSILSWFMSSIMIAMLTGVCIVASVSCLLYFRKKRLVHSRLEHFLNLSGTRVVAHRGGAADAPENTVVAMREAKKHGAGGVEMDVELTKDGVAVLMHDSTVDRTTDGTGYISELMWEDVRQLNAAAKYSSSTNSQFSYESVPTLDEVVQECLNLKLQIFFDVKAYSKKMVEELVKLYKKYPALYETSMVCSFFPQTIYRLRQQDSEILTALTTEAFFLCDKARKRLTGGASWWKLLPVAMLDKLLVWSMYTWLWVLCGNSAMLLHKNTLSHDVMSYWSARGLTVVPWTVNKRVEKEFLSSQLGCCYITDHVK